VAAGFQIPDVATWGGLLSMSRSWLGCRKAWARRMPSAPVDDGGQAGARERAQRYRYARSKEECVGGAEKLRIG